MRNITIDQIGRCRKQLEKVGYAGNCEKLKNADTSYG
jgi:hypothetical protein